MSTPKIVNNKTNQAESTGLEAAQALMEISHEELQQIPPGNQIKLETKNSEKQRKSLEEIIDGNSSTFVTPTGQKILETRSLRSSTKTKKINYSEQLVSPPSLEDLSLELPNEPEIPSKTSGNSLAQQPTLDHEHSKPPTVFPLASPLGKRARARSSELAGKKQAIEAREEALFPPEWNLIREYHVPRKEVTAKDWSESSSDGIIAEAHLPPSPIAEPDWEQIQNSQQFIDTLKPYYSEVPIPISTWCKHMKWSKYGVVGNGWCLTFAILSNVWKLNWNSSLPDGRTIEKINAFKKEMISKVLREKDETILKIFDIDVESAKRENIMAKVVKEHRDILTSWRNISVKTTLKDTLWGGTPLLKMFARELNSKILVLAEGFTPNTTCSQIIFPDTRMYSATPLPATEWLAHFYVQEPPFNEPIMITFVNKNHYEAILKPSFIIPTSSTKLNTNNILNITSSVLQPPSHEKCQEPLDLNNLWKPTKRKEVLIGGQALQKFDQAEKNANKLFLENMHVSVESLQKTMLTEERWKNYAGQLNLKNWGNKVPKLMRALVSRIDEKLAYVKDLKKKRPDWGNEIIVTMWEQKLRLAAINEGKLEVKKQCVDTIARLAELPTPVKKEDKKALLEEPTLWKELHRASNGTFASELEPTEWKEQKSPLFILLAVLSETIPRALLLKLFKEAKIGVPAEVKLPEYFVYISLMIQLYESNELFRHAVDKCANKNDWLALDEFLYLQSKADAAPLLSQTEDTNE